MVAFLPFEPGDERTRCRAPGGLAHAGSGCAVCGGTKARYRR
jgi:hypothetical protein